MLFTSLLAPHTKVSGDELATEEGILNLGRTLQALNRRRFLSTLAAVSGMAAAGALTTSTAQAQTTTPAITDVLNFALNFEYLEAEFYSYGGYGTSLAQSVANGTVTANAPTVAASHVLAPPAVTLAGNQLAVAQALFMDEAHHITLLQQTITSLGGTYITEPTIDFSASGTMPAVTTNVAFFAAARQFTALGNSAYAGAAADLISNTSVLMAAGQILGAEAQHLGVVNYLCATLGILPVSAGGPDKQIDAQDVPPNGTAALFTITPTNATVPAVGISRTPQQVLGVAYGVSTPATTTPPAGTTKGGFFPAGVLGNIVST
ncbi:ferritin-like domain-containing protein [Acidipila sp. EB88]|uniref:ferritin-like domain-containing protein n=1 Tax=Acidipila sp. EB88 TaxID=2305226 RepID=UPI000F5F6484|nr:ferritin-like domain-containing protein [Acidipila sp. EB88]RRA49091.1 ferritin-like domain-containing protein [Acidipila sp. EB88]